jgi:WD40 repeat protein
MHPSQQYHDSSSSTETTTVSKLSCSDPLCRDGSVARLDPRGPFLSRCTSREVSASSTPWTTYKRAHPTGATEKKRPRMDPSFSANANANYRDTSPKSTPFIPEHLLGTLVAPFLSNRETFNNFSLTSWEVYRACKSVPAPWPRQGFKVESVVQSVAFSTTGNLLACSVLHFIRIWNRRTGHCQVLEAPETVTCVAFSSDGKFLASGHRGSLESSSAEETSSAAEVEETSSAAEVEDPTTAATIKDDEGSVVRLWNLSTMSCVHVFKGHQFGGVLSVIFSPVDNILAAGGVDQTIRLWKDTECIHTLLGHSNWVYNIKFSPDGQTLASAGEDETAVWLWNLNDGGSSTTLEGHTECVHCIAFSPNSLFLASGSDDETIRIWDLNSRLCVKVLEGNLCSVWTICISPDSTKIASGARDSDGERVIRLWSVHDGTCQRTLRGHTNTVTSVAFSPSGRTVASGAFDRTVRLWNLSNEA